MPVEYVYKMFNTTYYEQYYQQLREKTKIIGIWDDHDFGCNGCGKDFKKKDLMREIYLDFLEEPKDSDRRKEKWTGLY